MARGQSRGVVVCETPLYKVMERDRIADLKRQVQALTRQLDALQPHQECRRVLNPRVVEEENDEKGKNPLTDIDQEGFQVAACHLRDSGRWESGLKTEIPMFHGDTSSNKLIDWICIVQEVLDFKEVPKNNILTGDLFLFREIEGNQDFVDWDSLPIYDIYLDDEGFVGFLSLLEIKLLHQLANTTSHGSLIDPILASSGTTEESPAFHCAQIWTSQRSYIASTMTPLEIEGGSGAPVVHVSHPHPHRRRQLNEMEREWLVNPELQTNNNTHNETTVTVCRRKTFLAMLLLIFLGVLVICLSTALPKTLSKHEHPPLPMDNYAVALKKALLFFDAQMSGRLPEENRIPWRGNSGLKDGSFLPDVKGGLIGGYYDGGDNIKSHFPMAFSMSMLSWSVIEYSHKYKAIGEYDHVREIIKWGTDYLLRTFDSSAPTIALIYSQVGKAVNGSSTPDDGYCWQRPEDMDYYRPVLWAKFGADLAGEMAAALASASIVFQDDATYSKQLISGATMLLKFIRDSGKRTSYRQLDKDMALVYNSTDYYDEYIWAATWMNLATGDSSYLSLATSEELPKHAHVFSQLPDLRILSWDNKLPAAELLLTRIRMILSPGYPYEELLRRYQDRTNLNMCSYLRRFSFFNWTRGGMIQLNHGRRQPLQYVANAAFISSLYVGYMDASGTPGWYCGSTFISSDELRSFASSQIDYILGANPMNMSYLVGFGSKFPQHVYHRGASIPNDGIKYSCTDGWKWRDSPHPNPNNITGAMVGGPDRFDQFQDARNRNYTEPTMAGNAGLVAALVSLTSSGGLRVDKNTIFSAIPPPFPDSPPPPPPWEPVP
ncbi:Glycoside hydrolase [Macleaya cordata]|uniref:cellulase n=1 Tax=Macleaya cordata TaxID=56857 RepID=A0A200QJI5_MACCD|nr:Glycoside hydrolase [Macleaya cordata]